MDGSRFYAGLLLIGRHAVIGITGKTLIMAALAESLSESLWPAAFGLVVALAALASYRYFTARLIEFDGEMRVAILEMETGLSRCGRAAQ